MNHNTAAQIATLLQAIENCQKAGNVEWERRHSETLDMVIRDHAPSGSGIDCGTQLDRDTSTPEKLVFLVSFHHMDEHGGYDGWTEHKIIVRASLAHVLDIRITGRDRNGIKEYLFDVFYNWLTSEVVTV